MQFLLNIYELFFLFFYNLIGSYGVAIVVLSIVFWGLGQLITLKLQPLLNIYSAYNDVVAQEAKRLTQEQLGKKEYFIRLNALYARYSYKPFFAIIKVTPLLVQLPFLIIAYHFFSSYSELEFQKFGPIDNLLQPDQIFLGIHLLPILMMGANLLAILFSVKQSATERTQSLMLSIVFFLLLYTQSAAVVLYWTTSNIMTLLVYIGRFVNYKDEDRAKLWCMICNFIEYLHHKRIWLFILLSGLFIHIFYRQILYSYLDLGKTTSYYVGRDILRYFGAILALSGLASISLLILKNKGITLAKKSPSFAISEQDTWRLSDGVLVLLPMSMIAYYLLANLALVEIKTAILSFVIITISILLIAFTFGCLLKRARLELLSLQFIFSWFTLLTLLPFLSANLHWAAQPDRVYPFVIFTSIFAGIIYMRKHFQSSLSMVCIITFITLATAGYFSSNDSASTNVQKSNISKEVATLLKKDPTYKPDILFLSYESYVPNTVMQFYGIDNRAQEDYLKQLGFDVYDNIYSVGHYTLASLSGVLDLKTNSPQLKGKRRRFLSGDSMVNFILNEKGYDTYGILRPYFFINQEVLYDHHYPKSVAGQFSKQLYRSILSGRFKFNAFDKDQANYSHSEWLEKKREVLQKNTKDPKFMHAHSPHPGHTQNSGKCLDNEKEEYQEGVEIANDEMKADIDAILKTNRDAVIIIAGDHGPYLLGDCYELKNREDGDITREELLDRFGVFLAVRWPEALKQEEPQKITILQEVFLLVFSKIFNEPLLEQIPLNSDSYEMGPAPQGAISKGMITSGKDKNKPLYE